MCSASLRGEAETDGVGDVWDSQRCCLLVFPSLGGVQVLDGGMQVGTSDLFPGPDGLLSSVLVLFAGRPKAHDDGRAENRLDDPVVIR